MDNPPVWNYLGPLVVHSYNYPNTGVLATERHHHSHVPGRLPHVRKQQRVATEPAYFTHRFLLHLGWGVNVRKSDLVPVQFIGGVFDTFLE